MKSKIEDAKKRTGYSFHRTRLVVSGPVALALTASVTKQNPVTYDALCILAEIFETRAINVTYFEDSYCGPSSAGSACDIVIENDADWFQVGVGGLR